MRRREFVAGLGSAVALSLAAHAQQSAPMRRIGVLMGWDESDPEVQVSVRTHRNVHRPCAGNCELRRS